MKSKLFLALFFMYFGVYSQYKRLDSIVGDTYKVHFFYDNNGKYTKYQDFFINADGTFWDVEIESTVIYNADNKIIEEISKIWYDIQFENYEKILFFYDSNGQISTKEFYQWTIANTWDLINIENYTYNANNLVQEISTSTLKKTFIYDSFNKLIRFLRYDWDTTNNNWYTQASFKSEYLYDGNENMISNTQFRFDQVLNQWVNDYSRNNYIYDNLFLEQNLILPRANKYNSYSNKFFFTHKIDNWEISFWDSLNSQYFVGYNLNFFYSDQTANLSENNLKLSKVFPNPFTDTVVFYSKDFYIDRIVIFNLDGRLLKEEFSKLSINLSDLKNGIYLYKVYAGNKLIGLGKLVKQ